MTLSISLTDDEVEELQNAMYAYLLSFSMANHPGEKRLAAMESAALKIGMVEDPPRVRLVQVRAKTQGEKNAEWWDGAGGRLGG